MQKLLTKCDQLKSSTAKTKTWTILSGPNGFIPKMQGWFNIQQISIVYHNNGEKGDYHYDLSN